MDCSRKERFGKNGYRFAIDRGGTFTDVYAECPDGKVIVMKLLSEDPAYPDAPTEAIRRVLEKVRSDLLLDTKTMLSAIILCSRRAFSYILEGIT